jgi:hypothetical protein
MKNPKEQILLICVLMFWLEVLKTLLYIFMQQFSILGFWCMFFKTDFQDTIFSNFGLQYVHNISTYPINENNSVLWVIGIRDVGF